MTVVVVEDDFREVKGANGLLLLAALFVKEFALVAARRAEWFPFLRVPCSSEVLVDEPLAARCSSRWVF